MKKLLSIIIILVVFSFQDVYAQDIFVKIFDNAGVLIPGESNDAAHSNEIKAISYGQQSSACTTGTPGCGVTTGNFIFNMGINKSVNLLRRSMYLLLPLTSVDIVFRKIGASPFEYYKIHLENVVVAGVSETSDGTGGLLNTFQISLDPQKLHWTYIPISPSGVPGTPIKFGYNRATNSEFIY